MSKPSPFRYFTTSPEIIRLAVMFHGRAVDVSHETARYWWHRFGPVFAAEIRKRRNAGMRSSR